MAQLGIETRLDQPGQCHAAGMLPELEAGSQNSSCNGGDSGDVLPSIGFLYQKFIQTRL